NNLRAGALRIAAGDLETRIPAKGSDEFAELAHRFNEMATAIASQQRKLIESQRLAVLGQLSAGVAHEINNPLGVILGYAKLLRPQTVEPKLRDGLRIIEDEAHQCQRIVEGLLGLARPAAMNREAIDLNLIVSGAIERLKEADKVAQRRIEVIDRHRSAPLEADAAAVRQVVSNLLLNAIDATAESGSITVAFGGDADSIEMVISDDGRGMSADVLERAFDPFFSGKPAGTGLGLAISQTIVATHGGTLRLESNLGHGTRAVVRLPRRTTPIEEEA
ncbi:MAG: ATP-binding protein, partial [Polyangiaceae bacterium]